MTTRPITPRLDALAALEATNTVRAEAYRSAWANDIARETSLLAAFDASQDAASTKARIELARTVGGQELATLLELEGRGPRFQAQAAVYASSHSMKLARQQRAFDAATDGDSTPPEAA